MTKLLSALLILLALAGLVDSIYLSYEHFANIVPPCTISVVPTDCGKVLRSDYALVMGIPLAVIGIIHYSLLSAALIATLVLKKKFASYIAVILSAVGFLSSLYFVYLQLIVIQSICIYCMASAGMSTLLFLLVQYYFSTERKYLFIRCMGFYYTNVVKRIFFSVEPEKVHNRMVHFGERLGKIPFVPTILRFIFKYSDSSLKQTVLNMNFDTPIGLAAGFDYEARLTQTLPHVGFGFETVGTITLSPYEGNKRPLLGRLPKSRSLMVNKGFKNLGARKTIQRLKNFHFSFPLGVSIGRTNSLKLSTQKRSIEDIVRTFQLFESSPVTHSYYELNISCPNLHGNITFYPSKNLDDLLTRVDSLKLSRPVFIKMPIEQSNEDVLRMLKIISQHTPAGVIFGNLQKDRNHPLLNQSEVSQFPVGNFSGKPTFDRSNELIKLTYKHYKKRFVIIGCGGVFNTDDAYLKIKLGATLVQLITGMIFEGPQLIARINHELPKRLHADGYSHISQAIGKGNR